MKKEPMTLEKLGTTVDKLGSAVEKIGAGLEKLTDRFDKFEKNVEEDIRGFGVLMESMDDKFTSISEGQDVILEVLETRVAHIEEILEVNVK